MHPRRPLAEHLASKAARSKDPRLVQLLSLQQVQSGFENADGVAKSVLDFLQEVQAGEMMQSCIIEGAKKIYAPAAAVDTAHANGKFAVDGDFELKYGSPSAHQAGLIGVIGPPIGFDEPSLREQVVREHTDVYPEDDWGASTREFKNNNYNVITTPAREWNFVANGGWTSPTEQPYRPVQQEFRASVCAAPTLNAAGESRVTLSLRQE